MKTQILLISTLITGLVAFNTVAFAGPDCDDKSRYAKYNQMSEEEKSERVEKRLSRMATQLNLTDEQIDQLRILKQTRRNEIKPLRSEQRAIRKEIRQLNPNDNDYAAKLADAANRQSELVRQLIIAKGYQRLQMASILTPEQLDKKKLMRGKMHKKHYKN